MPSKIFVLRLGEAGGKIKYTVLDEADIVLVRDYSFEAKLEVDKDGNAPQIFAIMCKSERKSSSSSKQRGKVSKRKTTNKYLHNVIWERHGQHIPSGKKVVHKNGITMDNRLENLMLLPEEEVYCPPEDQEDTFYWWTLEQMQVNSFKDHVDSIQRTNKKYYDGNGDIIKLKETEIFTYYECHYPPCHKLELEFREFEMCGRCQKVRYCGAKCQERDWHVHQKYCIEKVTSCERPPDR